MSTDTSAPMAGLKSAAAPETSLSNTIAAIGNTLAELDPGALAELRRKPADENDQRPAYFYRLVARHGISKRQEDSWVRIIRIMAILTAKGAPDGKKSPHSGSSKDDWRGLGTALCDGGDPKWGRGERAFISEQRFARLLAAKGEARAGLMERAARALATKKPVGTGVDCTQLARFLLWPDDPGPARALARDYYARLDGAARNDGNETGDTTPAPGDDA